MDWHIELYASFYICKSKAPGCRSAAALRSGRPRLRALGPERESISERQWHGGRRGDFYRVISAELNDAKDKVDTSDR